MEGSQGLQERKAVGRLIRRAASIRMHAICTSYQLVKANSPRSPPCTSDYCVHFDPSKLNNSEDSQVSDLCREFSIQPS